MTRSLLIIILVFLITNSYAQQDDLIDISGHADCENAITISTTKIFGPTTAPNGFGETLEIKDNQLGNKYYFEQEHNTVWYRFKIVKDGILTFDIIPENINDDYDFILYKVNSDEYFFCNYGVKNKIDKPIRSNISRNNKELRSMTGLEEEAQDEFINSGVGESYSKPIEVKTGELYYLVVDNVYDGGSGHSIIFNDSETYNISGIVKDETTGKPIKAEITLEDYSTGNVIARTETNSATGKYTLKVNKDSIAENGNYNLSIFAAKYFFQDKIYTAKEIITPQIDGFVSKLKALAKGKSLAIQNINFYGNSPKVLPKSKPYLKRIYKLLDTNKSLVILIEGHTNGVGMLNDASHQPLSEARAQTVYQYLIDNGIKKERLSTIGYGCTKMLYPNGHSSWEQSANRRVEIKIIEY